MRLPEMNNKVRETMKKGWLVMLALPALLMSGCSKKENYNTIALNKYAVELRSGDAETVYVTEGNPNEVVWRSMNEFVATVDKGQISALRIGTTRVWANSASVAVTVKGRYDLYDEPMEGLKWNMTRDAVVDKLGFPDGVADDVLTYEIVSTINSFRSYGFDANKRLVSASISVSKDYTTDLESFLGERYLLISTPDRQDKQYIDALTVADATQVVTLASYDDDFWIVTYRDIASYKW